MQPRDQEYEALVGRTAGEIRCLVDIACAIVASDLRIGAERSRAIDLACCFMRSDDSQGSLTLLDPSFHHADLVKSVGAFPAPAVSHPWNHEKANPVGACCGISAE